MASTSTEPRRLAALPGYDTAPDIYETPDLTDDTATTVRSPASEREPSDASETSEEDDGDGGASYGVSRRRLYPERARHRFGATSARVETRGVDLSDRVDGRRRGYGVRRRGGGREDAEEEEESLEQRIARLKREVEECRAEAERNKGASEAGEDAHDNAQDDLDSLSRLLASVEAPAMHPSRSKPAAPQHGDAREPQAVDGEDDDDLSDAQLLSRVTAFDARLAAVEQALGASSLDPARPDTVLATPLLPTLRLLDQQLSALQAAASLSSLEAASARLATLRRDAHHLTTADADADAAPLSDDDVASLRALYALLPNLQALGATVPSMIARLRSLRTLHAAAATAAHELDAVETRQAALDKELQAWRQGLQSVEAAVAGASEANGKNGRFVQGWVQELEARIKALGR